MGRSWGVVRAENCHASLSRSLQIANHTGQAEYEPVFDIDLLGEGEGEDHPFDVAVEQANAQHESVAYFDAETG
jgi:hypothetical protein